MTTTIFPGDQARAEWEDLHGRVIRVRPSDAHPYGNHVTTEDGDWLVEVGDSGVLLTTELCQVCLHKLGEGPCWCEHDDEEVSP